MIIRFLGTHNAESRNTRLASFLIDNILAVDAGSLASELSFSEQREIKAILLSHGHYDHIKGIPALVFNNQQQTVKVFATAQTLEILASHLIDGVIYPKFTEKNSFLEKPAIELNALEPFKLENIEGYRVLTVPVNHPIGGMGFEITDEEGRKIFYTGDTGPGLSSIWEHVSPHLLITDATFPNRLKNVAQDSGHLCPEMLAAELTEFRRVKGYIPQVVLVHLSPQLEGEIRKEVCDIASELMFSINIAREGDEFDI